MTDGDPGDGGLGEAKYVGAFPVRQDITVLPPSPPRVISDWIFVGGPAVFHDPDGRVTVAEPDGIVPGDTVYVPYRGLEAAVVREGSEKGKYVGEISEHVWSTIEFCKIRKVWMSTCICVVNPDAIARVSLDIETEEG